MAENKIKISIIIPTYNHKNRFANLRRLLLALKNQAAKNINSEIIIVDNGCSLEICERRSISQLLSADKDFRIVKEPRIGLSNARNRGILSSSGEIIAFLDDDIIPSREWLASLISAYKFSSVLCVGGPVITKNNNLSLPKWFSNYFLRFLIPPKFPRKFGIMAPPFYLIGANMSFKRIVFREYGLFDLSLGRKGDCLLSGEDTEFISRLNPADVYFEPAAVVFTEIKPGRLSRKFFAKRIFWQAVSESRIARKHGLIKLYDKHELFFSKEFIEKFLKLLKDRSFFQAFCILVRIITFRLALLLRL